MDLEHESRLTAVEERAKSNTHRLDKLEESNAVLNRLATSMEVMAERQQHCNESVDTLDSKVSTLDGKVTALEQKPAKRWEAVVEKVLLVVVGAVVGLLLKLTGITA